MIDGFLNTLKRSGERVQRRSEEVAQAARLRLDIFQLGREQGEMYARLGRAYHAGAQVSTLEEIRAEISRVDEEISAREKLLAELGADPDLQPGQTQPVNLSKDAARTATGQTDTGQAVTGQTAPGWAAAAIDPAATQTRAARSDVSPASSAAPPPIPTQAAAPTALSVWREKEAERMTDSDSNTDHSTDARTVGPATDATGRPDGEADPTARPGGDPHKNPYASPTGAATNPNEAGNPEKLRPASNTASMGDESARDEMVRRKNHLEEGRAASENPDPLAMKD